MTITAEYLSLQRRWQLTRALELPCLPARLAAAMIDASGTRVRAKVMCMTEVLWT